MLRDGYPRLYSSEMPLELFFSSYLSTYVERDVAGYLNVRNVTAFHKFLRLCGLRVKMCVWLGVSRGLDLAFLNAD